MRSVGQMNQAIICRGVGGIDGYLGLTDYVVQSNLSGYHDIITMIISTMWSIAGVTMIIITMWYVLLFMLQRGRINIIVMYAVQVYWILRVGEFISDFIY